MTLAVRQARFRYPGSDAWVLDGVDLALEPGTLLGLIGPNGAGKSSLVKLLSGAERPQAGDVLLRGAKLATVSRRALAQSIAVVDQEPELPDGFPVSDVVAMGRSPYVGFLRSEREEDLAVVARVLNDTDLWRLRSKDVRHLSGGERQRVALARALAQDPDFLLLDEPTSHLDVRYQLEILDRARTEARRGRGVLAVLHDLNMAARCDRLVLLGSGLVIAEGTPAEVLQQELLASVYGAPLLVGEVAGQLVVVPGQGL